MASTKSILRDVRQLFNSDTIYMISNGELSTTVTKIDCAEKLFKTTRYKINGSQCSCIDFMKKKTCKHLKMLTGEYEGKGAEKSKVLNEIKRVVAKLAPYIPDLTVWNIDWEIVPSTVTVIKISMKTEDTEFDKLVIVKNVDKSNFVLYITKKE